MADQPENATPSPVREVPADSALASADQNSESVASEGEAAVEAVAQEMAEDLTNASDTTAVSEPSADAEKAAAKDAGAEKAGAGEEAEEIKTNGFEPFNLLPILMKAINHQGFTAPTPIQAAALPPLLEGKDLMGIAQTGGGKTGAFLLPLLQRLENENLRPAPRKPRAVILAPTRELAMQIGQAIYDFGRRLRLRHTVVYGGAPYRPQLQALNRGVDILVATPGRLIDHLDRGSVRFDDCNHFILDEADRMLDMGFVEDVTRVADLLPAHQTILFSATMNSGVRRFAQKLLNDPVQVEMARESTVAHSVEHKVMHVARRDKRALLQHLLAQEGVGRTLVFVRTKMDADLLSAALEDEGLSASAIHGDKPQKVRQRTLSAFRHGRFDILVATDVAARGIDVPDITHVFNFDLPMEAEAYVHRIGRTGRAGAKGLAISFCDNHDHYLLKAVERAIRQKVEIDSDQPYHLNLRPSNDNQSKKGKGGKGRGFGKGGKPFAKGGKPAFSKGGKPKRDGDGEFKKSGFKKRDDDNGPNRRDVDPFKSSGYKRREAENSPFAKRAEGIKPHRKGKKPPTKHPHPSRTGQREDGADKPLSRKGKFGGKAGASKGAEARPFRKKSAKRVADQGNWTMKRAS
ncbi:DEAD/DEAH box helicase [Rhodovibrionaceae bacterium A322]